MKNNLFKTLLFLALAVLSLACKKVEEPKEPAFDAAGNESFTESNLPAGSGSVDASGRGVVIPGELWVTPAKPNADKPLTITLTAAKGTNLSGYTGDVYAHIGILEYGTWRCVQADWTENIDKCKFVKDPSEKDTWHLALEPTVREYFDSGTTAVTQIGLVIRTEDSAKKQYDEDLFISVVDDVYKPFIASEYETKSVPSGCGYGINAQGSSITFVLHDQNKSGSHKDYAYIIGDFNNWTLTNDEKSRMYRDDAKGCWWITVDGLDPDKEYRFQYHLGERSATASDPDKIVRLSDPFCEKILDPDNDKWINEKNTIYPADQMQYPDGGVSTVSCVKINRDSYAWSAFEMKNKDCPVIYELLLGDYTATHDLAGAMAKLDYLQTLGVNAIELMPIQEFDGNNSWGYNPNHYFALDKAYGTRKQYKDFIEACHQRGIAVIIDVVYNHNTGASPLAKMYWNSSSNETAANNPYFFVKAMHDANVFHDVNHSNKFVQEVVKRSLQYLITEYNVDGFRFDLSKGFTWSSSGWGSTDNNRIALIKDYAKAIRTVDPDSYIILEHWGNADEESQYVRDGMHPWQKANHAYCQAAMGYKSESDLWGSYRYLDETWSASGWVTYMESHDEERMAYKQEKYGHSSIKGNLANSMSNLVNNAVCFLTVPGPKMIWQMGELGYNYNKWCNEQGVDGTADKKYETDRKPVKWDYLNNADRKRVYDAYCKLNKLRNDNPDLFGKGVTIGGKLHEWPLKTVELAKGSKKLYAYANYFGDDAGDKTLTIPSGTWTDILSGKTVNGGSYTLKTGQALVLVNSAVVK